MRLIAAVMRGECLLQARLIKRHIPMDRKPLKFDPRGKPVGGEAPRHFREQTQRIIALTTGMHQPRERDSRVGARRLELHGPAQRRLITFGDEQVGLRREQRVKELVDRLRGLYADELVDDGTVSERLDRWDPLDSVRPGEARIGVGVDLRQLELAGSRGDRPLEHRSELAAGSTPLGPEVDHDRQRPGALDHVGLKACLVYVHTLMVRRAALRSSTTSAMSVELTVQTGGVSLSVEQAGEGIPIVLLHGLTATRRYVVMGSRVLERSGHRVVSYDARGHGRSSGASDPAAYTYDELASDLTAVLDALGLERAVLAGASMGAHTLLAFALRAPERVAGMVVITPAYDGTVAPTEAQLARWDALSEGLRTGGVDGFVAAYGRPAVASAFQETVIKVIRQRLSAHEHPEAVADALRAVPRSRPFGTLGDLSSIEAPTIIVASGDDADPEHPFAVAERYAAAIPGATLVTEEPGSSPLAWQGSRLSHVIAQIAERF